MPGSSEFLCRTATICLSLVFWHNYSPNPLILLDSCPWVFIVIVLKQQPITLNCLEAFQEAGWDITSWWLFRNSGTGMVHFMLPPWVENFPGRGSFPQNLGWALWQLSRGLELSPKNERENHERREECGAWSHTNSGSYPGSATLSTNLSDSRSPYKQNWGRNPHPWCHLWELTREHTWLCSAPCKFESFP